MEIQAGLELSPRKVDYLKFIFEQGGIVKTNDVALHFEVDPSTITKTISDLADIGYLSHIPYRGVELTDNGRRHAEFLIKRHRILSLMLVRNGLSEIQACREVTRFESLVTREAIDIMCNAMGHPQKGTCGEITHDDGCLNASKIHINRNGVSQGTGPEILS